MKLLFLTWDGPGTTYHESLFFPLLQNACRETDAITVVQYTRGDAERTRRLGKRASELDIDFTAAEMPRASATFLAPLMIFIGAVRLARNVRRSSTDLVLARSVIPAAMALLARGLLRLDVAFVYDADGLVADEHADFGGWSRRGARYRLYQWIERMAVRRAEVVLVRTTRAREILQRRAGVAAERFVIVINGKDETVFSPGTADSRRRVRCELGIPEDCPIVVYAGSIGPQYEAEAMIATFGAICAEAPDARLLLMTSEQHHGRLRRLTDNVPDDRVVLRQVEPDQVPATLAVADLGLGFRTATLSQQTVAPIKIAEYLLCGVPVAFTSGVGDLDAQLDTSVALAVAHEPDENAVARWLLEEVMPHRDELRVQCRELGVETFALEVGAAGYRQAFDLALSRHRH